MNVLVKKYDDIKVNKDEVFRYVGIIDKDEDFSNYIDDAIAEFNGKQKFSVCYIALPININGDEIDFSSFKVKSKALAKCLTGCENAVIFVATIGLEIDRLIMKYSSLSISKAICLNALGTERVESLCDAFSKDIEKEVFPKKTTMRFSPGYGDLPLEMQKDIFAILNCNKNIGVSLNESLLMSPSKSVSAIIGIKDGECNDSKNKCQTCKKEDCEFKK